MRIHALSLPLLLSLGACAASDNDKSADTDTDADGTTDTDDTGDTADTAVVDLCGNDAVDEGEQCDFGAANAAEGNCTLDCVLADEQHWTISLSALPAALVDAVGVTFADAPLGTGAWSPPDADLDGDDLAKLQLNLPLYDPRTDLGFSLLQLPDFPLDKISDDDPIGTVTLADIVDVQFDARFPEGQRPRFYLYLYTQPDGTDDAASWYGHRLLAFTGNSTPEPAADTWTRYSVAGPSDQFLFWDQDATGVASGDGQTLAALTASSTFDWADVDAELPSKAIDYASEVVRYVSIQTSSGTGTVDFDGAIDRLHVTIKGGRSITIDLEP